MFCRAGTLCAWSRLKEAHRKFLHVINALVFVPIILAVLVCAHPSIRANAAPQEKTVSTLEPGKPIQRQLAGGGSDSYRISVASGEYLHVVVDQRGIDVVVLLFDPNGKKIAEIDSPNGTQGPEPVSLIAETSGDYKLEIRSLEKDASAGRYEARIVALRLATADDTNRLKAQKILADADALLAQRTATSVRQAIDKYQQALPLWRAANDPADEAKTLKNLGEAHYLLRNNQLALESFDQALVIFRSLADRQQQADTLNTMALVYHIQGDNQKAITAHDQALALFRDIGDRAGQAVTLHNLGRVYAVLGDKERALEYLGQALTINRDLKDLKGQAFTLNSLGGVFDDLAENQKALARYDEALQLWRALGDRQGEALTLNNIGAAYSSLGEYNKAVEVLTKSLEVRRSVGDRNGEAEALSNMGIIYSRVGENQKALDSYNQALLIFRAITYRRGEATVLNSIGLLYGSLGEKQAALNYYNQALTLWRALGDRHGEALTLNNIGLVHDIARAYPEALDYYNQSLKLRRAVGDRRGEANSLGNIGSVYNSSGERLKALDFLNQALQIALAVGDRLQEENTLANLGSLHSALSDKQKAIDFLNQALAVGRALGNRSGEAQALYKIATVERDRNNLIEARTKIEAALAIIESLRTKIASEQLRASYFASVQQYYELYVDVLMRLHKLNPSEGHSAVALQVSERARARSLLDLLIESHADIREGVDPQLLARERELQQLLNAKAERQLRLLSGKHTEESAQAAAKELETLTTEYQGVEAQIRARSPRYAALTQPQPLTLKEIQTQVLDPDTLLLEYALGDDRSYLWAVTQTVVTSYELPKRAEIEDAARSLYKQFASRNRAAANKAGNQRGLGLAETDGSLTDAANRLSRIVLAPIAARLGKKRLVIVADGALQYVPFGALPSPAIRRSQPGPPLIVEHEIVNLPSASTLAVLRRELAGRKPAVKVVAVLADPVFDPADERVKKDGPDATRLQAKSASSSETRVLVMEESAHESGVTEKGLRIPRLPGTRREAEAILSLVQPTESKRALDFAASRATIADPDLSQYRYLHFATHGLLNSVHPELSGLVLSMIDEQGTPQDGFLRAHEIFNLHLPTELVVLSACQTGLGQEVRGEGIVGLTRGFMYAGAPRVVVSLWSVSDVATAELMARFYREMLVNKLRPAAALRAAQVALRRQPRRASPFYWAAFTFQGEWR